MKLRVGLVGLGGQWENRYRPALRALSDRFEVRAVCDPVMARAELAARDFEAAPVDGFRALARRSDIEAMLLLSDGWYGMLPLLAACSQSKAIYCAAALDITLEDAQLLRKRVESSGVAFMAELSRRHAPATLRLKELIATQLGAPRLLFCHLRKPTQEPPTNGRLLDYRPLASDANSLVDVMELVDFCRYVVGTEPTTVQGTMHKCARDGAVDDYQMMSLDFSPADTPGIGAVAQISCGRYVPASWKEAVTFRPPAALQVACEKGIAFVDLPSSLIWFDEAGRHQESLESERPLGEQLLTSFYRSVTSLVRNTSSLADAYRALEIVLSARQGHREGRRIPV